MKKIPFAQGRFLASAFEKHSFPHLLDPQGAPLPEIALVGRSNVGKSSLINHLLKNKTLAKTSSTPGKTQSVNFFTVDEQLLLVDLPGYGYAKVSKQIRKKWAPLIETYLEERPQLKLILLLLDSRRELNPDDRSFIEWARLRAIPLLLVFTKADKLGKSGMSEQPTFPDATPSVSYSIKEARARIILIETLNRYIQPHGTHQ